MSGRLSDGARGALRIKRAGGQVFAQDPDTCRFPDMPIAAIQLGGVGAIGAPEDLASAVTDVLSRRNVADDASGWSEPFGDDRAN